ncbi:MAG TPA: hypothetical protein VFO41_18120 [Alphaproteobacteria bacterium]|nr:hypothetical protein [Alphaproteobacteria bacterium]
MAQTVAPSTPAVAAKETAPADGPPAAPPGNAAVDAANEAVARLRTLMRGLRLPRLTLPRLRLLPGVIFVAALMLGVRTTDLMNGMAAGTIDAGTPAGAQASDPEPTPPAEAADATAAAAAAEPAAETPAGATDVVAMLPPDHGRSGSELDLLQSLSVRRQELQDRERALSQREALLAVAEQRFAEKSAELEMLRTQIEDLLGQVDEQREAQLANLVGIYENMRPKDAAAIFDGLDLEVLINVLDRMREQKSAAILAGMNPERARQVTTELAQRRQLPSVADAVN